MSQDLEARDEGQIIDLVACFHLLKLRPVKFLPDIAKLFINKNACSIFLKQHLTRECFYSFLDIIHSKIRITFSCQTDIIKIASKKSVFILFSLSPSSYQLKLPNSNSRAVQAGIKQQNVSKT